MNFVEFSSAYYLCNTGSFTLPYVNIEMWNLIIWMINTKIAVDLPIIGNYSPIRLVIFKKINVDNERDREIFS
jgi:hypothetical protein